MIAYSYIRWSSGRQQFGDSLRRQTEATLAYCQRRGWTLDETLNLRDMGVSAFRGRNAGTGALKAFLDAVEEGKVNPGSALIMESMDRLSRDCIMDAVSLFQQITRQGIRIVSLVPEREYTWEGINREPFSLFELLTIFMRANEESAMKSKRSSANWRNKQAKSKERPVTSMCPQWLRVVDGRFVEVPAKVAIVQRIFRSVIAGKGVSALTKQLNAEGVPSIGKQSRIWHMSYIAKILHNRAVLGEYQPMRREGKKRIVAGAMIPGYYPVVISGEDWHRAHGALTTRQTYKGRRGHTVANLFSGLLRDARDGETMRVVDKGKKGQKMLVSNGACRGQQGSIYLGFSYRIFEAAFLHFVKELTPAMIAPPEEPVVDKIEALRGQIDEMDDRIAKLKKRLMSAEFDTLLDLLTDLETKKKEAEGRLDELLTHQASRQQDDLGEAKSLLAELEKQSKVDENDLRERLRNKVRQFVSEMWMLVSSENRYHRQALCQVFFRNGGWRLLSIETGKKEHTLGTMSSQDFDTPEGMDLRKWRFEDAPIES